MPAPSFRPSAMRLACLLLSLLLALLPAHAVAAGKGEKLQQAQYAWSAAIRWGDFENAWNLVAPAMRAERPMSALEFERYKQIKVSSYRDLTSRGGGRDEAFREIEIGVVNRHTMAERTLRYTEHWVYDRAAKNWWIAGGLPDFWDGQ